MAEFERIPEPKDKLAEFQKKYNTASKSTMKLLGENIAIFVCMLLPIILIGFIWSDVGTPALGLNLIPEGVVTVTLFVIGEMMMAKIGADGGKLDSEYICAKEEFNKLVAGVHNIGTSFLNIFCDWQIDVELEHAVSTRLRALYMTRSEWNEIKDKSYTELKAIYGSKKAKCIAALNGLEPIELNEAILLFDNAAEGFARGGVPISGERYIHNPYRSLSMILSAVFAGFLTVSVAITLTSDISWARVVYTIFKLVVLLYRMALGYSRGAKAYNTIEVVQLQAKCNYLRQYIRFVNDKTYLKLDGKHGDIIRHLDNNNIQTEEEELVLKNVGATVEGQ